MSKKDAIRKWLTIGASYSEIAKAIGCSTATISYHAEKLGLSRGGTPRYNWDEIQAYHDAGHRRAECIKQFGFSKAAWDDAIQTGRIKPHDHRIPISALLVEGRDTKRAHLKTRLLQAGLLEPKCYGCGITEWHGQRLPLELDHVDGNGKNNRLENLRLLCPNCHSQTATWGGKNKKLRGLSEAK